MFIKLFRSAGATGHVFLLKDGRTDGKGLAWSGLVGPWTTVAVVPTTQRILDFTVETRSKDNQNVTVTGDIKVRLEPLEALPHLDFTVNPKNGTYVGTWEEELRAIVVAEALRPIHDKAKDLDVEIATRSQQAFEDAVEAGIAIPEGSLAKKGIIFESCSITKVEAEEEIEGAIGAKERQAMLTLADTALHKRRIEAAGNDRAVRTYEAETALRLETERAKLIERQGENKTKEATIDAAATKIRLEPLEKVEAGKMLGAALIEMAKGGRIGTLAIGPELLAALQQK